MRVQTDFIKRYGTTNLNNFEYLECIIFHYWNLFCIFPCKLLLNPTENVVDRTDQIDEHDLFVVIVLLHRIR